MSSLAAAIPTDSADLAEVRARLRPGARAEHFYAALLGLRTYEPLRLYQQLRRGLTYGAFERLQRNTALPARTLADLAEIPTRTLARRREEGRLDPDESDRLLRVARVFGRALELFEVDAAAARTWLTAPQPALGGLVPLELARTDVGAREVEHLVGRLEHGIPS